MLCLPKTQLTLGSNARSFLSTSNFSLGSWCMCWYNICHPWQAVAKLLFSFSHAMSSNHSEITATSQNCTSTSHNCFSQLLVTIYKQSFIASSLLAQDLANVAFWARPSLTDCANQAMGFSNWLIGEQNEISFRLVSNRFPESANPIRVTLFRESGQVSVESRFGEDHSGFWDGQHDSEKHLVCNVPVPSMNQNVDLHFYIIENTHVFACRDDPATLMVPWKSPHIRESNFWCPQL